MFHRIVKPLNSRSFFLFGARGTGKSTYIKSQWGQDFHYINLLLDRWERRYQGNPDLLISDIQGLEKAPKWVVIDEIQKVPKLLDIVHELIESTSIKFVLTGSSARKLKKMSANLLAGRAFNYRLYPMTYVEQGETFNLDFVLNWGALPLVFSLETEDRAAYLRSYCQTYLKEEILQEQIVRNGIAFRSFLEIAAQGNGKTLNFSKISKDVGVDTKTIQNFFQILEDTHLGVILPAYSRSARKALKLQPKFYLFDLGVKRAMEGSLDSPLVSKTSAYGNAFEHFMILECLRLSHYKQKDFHLSHYQTGAGGEIDLVLTKHKEVIAVEIKSTHRIDEVEVKKLARTSEGIKATKIIYVSQDETRSMRHGILCLHWRDFLKDLFLS